MHTVRYRHPAKFAYSCRGPELLDAHQKVLAHTEGLTLQSLQELSPEFL